MLIESESESADKKGEKQTTYLCSGPSSLPAHHQFLDLLFSCIYQILGHTGLADPAGCPGLAGLGSVGNMSYVSVTNM